MVTPAPVELGTATVTAAGVVTWRGSTYATDTGGHTVGDVVTVLRAGGRVAILPTPSGPGSYLPLTGGTITGDLEVTGQATAGVLALESGSPFGDPRLEGEAGSGSVRLDIWVPEVDGATPVFPMVQYQRGPLTPRGTATFHGELRATRGVWVGAFGSSTPDATIAMDTGDISTKGRVVAPGVPWAMAAGRQAMTLTNADTVAVVVPFPTNLFTPGLFPIITASPAGGTTPVDLFVSNVSSAGFTLTMKSRTGAITLTQNVAWHAVQMTANTAESPAATLLPAPTAPKGITP